MKILTFNVNSINIRYETVLHIIQHQQPDILCLQEIKCVNSIFSSYMFPNYDHIVNGEKAYNGVAILYKKNLPVIKKDDHNVFYKDHQARYVALHLENCTVASMYVPNGGSLQSEKYPYKLKWLQAFQDYAIKMIDHPICFCGDYNIIPYDMDAYHPEYWYNSPLGTLQVRSYFRSLLGQGYGDALRLLNPDGIIYTFWDYTKGAFLKDFGIRLDHFLLSPSLVNTLQSVTVLRDYRNLDRPSDHAPVLMELDFPVTRSA